jgi:hypothetical protein
MLNMIPRRTAAPPGAGRGSAFRGAAVAPALIAALSACDTDPVSPGDRGPGDVSQNAVALPVVGHGEVNERYTAEVAARGDWAYTSTWSNRGGVPGNAVKIWDVSGPTPVLADSLIIEGASTTGDVQISDDGSLLVVATERAGGSIVIYDLNDPGQPERLARFSSRHTRETGVHTVKLGRVNGRHYAFLSVNPEPAQLVIVDITDPREPVEVLVRRMGNPFVHDVFVRDGLLFTALWHDGMTIWDIGGGGAGGSPEDPVELGNVRTVGGYVHNIWWFHDPADGSKRYVFVGEEGPGSVLGSTSSGDVHVVDASDLRNPREVAFFHVAGAGAHNFVLYDEAGILYAAFYNGGVRARDVRGDLEACEADERAADGRCDLRLMGREIGTALADRSPLAVWGVAKVGPWLYASDMLTGLYKIDLSPLGH